MRLNKSSYNLPLLFAVGIHLLILIILFIEIGTSTELTVNQTQVKQERIIQAQTIDSKQLQAEVNRISVARALAKQKELKRAQKLKQEQRAAAKRLAQLEKQAKDLKYKQKKEALQAAQNLKKLKAQQVKETTKLNSIKKSNQVLQAQKDQEAKRLAELKKQQEKLLAQKKQREQAHTAKINKQLVYYKELIIDAIGNNWILPPNVDKSLSCRFRISLAPNGEVVTIKLEKSSGNLALDRSAETAILRASPLPVPRDAELFDLFKVVNLTVRPEKIIKTIN